MDQPRAPRRFGPPTWYWFLAIAIFVFGLIGAWSIGIPIAAFGVALVLLGLLWNYPVIYWPLAIVAFGFCLTWFVRWAW